MEFDSLRRANGPSELFEMIALPLYYTIPVRLIQSFFFEFTATITSPPKNIILKS